MRLRRKPMNYSIEVLPDDPIIWLTLGADYYAGTDSKKTNRDVLKILDASRGPMVAVADLRSAALDWEQLLYLANHGASEEVRGHPNHGGFVFITTDDVVSAVAQNVNTETFGFVKLDIVTSSEEALARARKLLA
jgi:hypothetical protein